MAKSVFAKFSESELQVRLRELKAELFNFRFQRATGKLENFRKLRAIKKDIARVNTFLTKREKAKV